MIISHNYSHSQLSTGKRHPYALKQEEQNVKQAVLPIPNKLLLVYLEDNVRIAQTAIYISGQVLNLERLMSQRILLICLPETCHCVDEKQQRIIIPIQHIWSDKSLRSKLSRQEIAMVQQGGHGGRWVRHQSR